MIKITDVTESNTALVIKFQNETEKLFIKTIKTTENVYHSQSMRETEFYRFIKANSITNVPLPKCHDIFLSEEKGVFLIVLDDVSETHTAPRILDKNIWFSCAESLAKLHAAFWEHKSIKSMYEEDEAHVNKLKERVPQFINDFSDKFDDRTKNTLLKAMEISVMQLKETAHRVKNNENVTICNGDSHIHNFMIPVAGNGSPLIVDFQFWGEGLGTGDLAHLTRVDFSDKIVPLVECYHKALLANGVSGYSWDCCFRDYRMSAASMVLIPMWQYTGFGLGYEKWKDNLQNLVDDFDCLKCGEIL